MNPHLFPVLARLPTTGHTDRESEEESRLHLAGEIKVKKKIKSTNKAPPAGRPTAT